MSRYRLYRDSLKNLFKSAKSDLSYIIDSANWSIGQDGYYIARSLQEKRSLSARTTISNRFIKSKIIHYGYEGIVSKKCGMKKYPNQKKVLTWFHVVPENKENRYYVENQTMFDIIHTSCKTTRNALVSIGIKKDKIRVVPLGVDIELFKPTNEKEHIKKILKIPFNAIVIGSFQKDGSGWGEGNEPKLIKGPDILVSVIKKLSLRYPVHVLLTGPARGFVINNLRNAGVAYSNIGYLKQYHNVARYYRALDLYLITSRIEGGPKSILEAWASGVPVVSTKVGMIPDIAQNRKDAMIADIGDVEMLYSNCCEIIDNELIRREIKCQGINKAKSYSWDKIAQQYYEQIYSRLL